MREDDDATSHVLATPVSRLNLLWRWLVRLALRPFGLRRRLSMGLSNQGQVLLLLVWERRLNWI